MSNNFKFEFNLDEVLEGIKQGVIRELSEENFDEAKNLVITQLKTEIKNKIRLTYNDESDLKDEIKKEIKESVFKKITDEINEKYLDQFKEYIELQLKENPERLDAIQNYIKKKVSDDLYNNLHYDLQEEIQSNLKRFYITTY